MKKPYSAPILIWSDVGTKLVGTLLAAHGVGLITLIGSIQQMRVGKRLI